MEKESKRKKQLAGRYGWNSIKFDSIKKWRLFHIEINAIESILSIGNRRHLTHLTHLTHLNCMKRMFEL